MSKLSHIGNNIGVVYEMPYNYLHYKNGLVA